MLKCYIRHRMADKNIKNVLELMNLSGVSRNAITKLYYSDGIETVKVDTLMRLCNALDCSLSDLIEYVPDKK